MARARAAALALVAALGACAAWSAPLGTLFMSPEQRERLDRLRRGETPAEGAPHAATGAREITGYVKRSDGRSTVWIDGRPETLANPRAARAMDPEVVRAYSESAGQIHVERDRPR
jgi:hypothetical protein